MAPDLKSKYSTIADNGNAIEVLDYLYELYDSIPIPSVIINQDYIIHEASQQFLDAFDYERNEVIGKNFIDFIDPENKTIFLNSITKLKNFDSIFGIEFQILKKDRFKVDVSFSAKIGNKFAEDSTDIFCILEDISYRKAYEKNLEMKNSEMALLLDNIGLHVWCLKDKETYGIVNKAHASFLGYSKDYLDNRNLNDFLPKEIAEIYIEGNNKVFSQKKTLTMKEWALDYKGEKRLLKISKTPILNSNGDVGYVVCIGSDITDLKNVEEVLKENQERIRCLVEGSIDAIWASTKEGIIVEANQAAADMLGCSLKDLIGKNITDFYVNPEDRLSFRGEVEKKKSVKGYEVKLKRRDGITLDCLFSSSIWTNSNNEILGYIGIVHDITYIKKTNKELSDSRHLLQNIIDSLPDATFSIDKGGKVLSWNKKIEKMTGIKSEEIIGKGNYEHSIPFYGERRPGLVDLILNTQEDFEKKYGNLKKCDDTIEGESNVFDSKGNIVHVWAKATVLRDNSGKVIGAIESIRDITEGKLVENELKKVYTAIDQGPGIIVITDLNGNIEYVNPKFTEVTGYNFEEIRGENPRILKSKYLPQEFYKSLWDTISSGSTWKGEFHNRKKDGDYYWEYATIAPVRNNVGEIINYIKVSEDITMKKKVKKQIDENIEYFAHLIDHIRNPLAILSGFIQVKVEEGKTKERLLRQVDRIEEIIKMLDKGWMDTEDTKRFLKKYG
ncbi:MAG: PAS domain S-box protein [Candidatus Methanofastidiosa archaeon]|nr:PAS domain S-box protein [Candidatus Methanofastidiosa archaeon]